MNPRLRRVVVAFLAGFVLLSLAPAAPELGRALAGVDVVAVADTIGRWSDALLGLTAALLTLALGTSVRRSRRRRQGAAFAEALSRYDAGTTLAPAARRESMVAPSAARRAPAAPASALEGKIRSAAKKGERLPALARRHGISIDAVRAALGDSLPAPVAPPGSSFRGRQQRLPAKSPASLSPQPRKAYGALA